MTAPTFSFTVTGATHAEIVAGMYVKADVYWGHRHRYHIVSVDSRAYDGEIEASVVTKQAMVVA